MAWLSGAGSDKCIENTIAARRYHQGRIWKTDQGKVMNELNLEFIPMQNATPTELGFPAGNRLGRIVLSVTDGEGKHNILDINWNFDELLVWFANNRTYMERESLPQFVRWDGSIHKSIESTYEEFDACLDEQLDELFEYRRRHEICFGMRGVKIPALYIGVGEQGPEVSGERDGIPFRFTQIVAPTCRAVGDELHHPRQRKVNNR